MHILENGSGRLAAGEGFLCLTEALTGENFYFFGRDEFTVQIQRNGVSRVYSSGDLAPVSSKCADGGIVMRFEGDGFGVELVYRDCGDSFSKTVTVTQSTPGKVLRICAENRELSATPYRGGEGQPVFAVSGGACLWAGTEFPVCYNGIIKNRVDFTQAPFDESDTVSSFPVVYGVAAGDPFTAFSAYIRRHAIKNEPLRVYCDWALHCEGSVDGPELTAQMTLDNIKELKEFERRSGVKFDYYLMDAFWFETGVPYTRFKKKNFPDGPAPVVSALKEAGMKFGLWFDINCASVGLPGAENLKNGAGGALCLGCKETADMLYEGISRQIDECGIDMIKLDFGFFDCSTPAHGHSIHPHEHKERAVRYFMDVMDRLRQKKPGLKILAYNGFTTSLEWIGAVKYIPGYAVSPYWSSRLDYVYCGDPRPSDSAFSDFTASVNHYNDCMTSNHVDSCFPLKNTDDSGTMVGVTDTIYRQGRATFRRTILSNLMRGTMKLNLYGDVRLLNDADTAYFGYINGIFDRICNEFEFRTVAGDPRRDEPYGYEASKPGEGYVMLCAPGDRDASITVKLPGRCEVCRIITDGELTGGRCIAEDSYTAAIKEGGYVLLHYTAVPSDRSAVCVPLAPGDDVTLSVAGYGTARLNFTLKGDPYRVPDAVPPSVTVTLDGKPVLSDPPGVWSGKSWLYVKTGGASDLRIKNDGDLIYEIRLVKTK